MKDFHNEKLLDEFLCSENLKKAIADMDGIVQCSDPFDKVQWLVHLYVEEKNYCRCHFSWPSSYVMGKVSEVLHKHNQDWCQHQLSSSLLAGKLFEYKVRNKLTAEGWKIFHMEGLSSDKQLELPLPTSVQYFTNRSDFAEYDLKVLCLPSELNIESLDFVYGEWLLQTICVGVYVFCYVQSCQATIGDCSPLALSKQ